MLAMLQVEVYLWWFPAKGTRFGSDLTCFQRPFRRGWFVWKHNQHHSGKCTCICVYVHIYVCAHVRVCKMQTSSYVSRSLHEYHIYIWTPV